MRKGLPKARAETCAPRASQDLYLQGRQQLPPVALIKAGQAGTPTSITYRACRGTTGSDGPWHQPCLSCVSDTPVLTPQQHASTQQRRLMLTTPCSCTSKHGMYRCPRCNAPYCSAACYKQHGESCTESFYRCERVHGASPAHAWLYMQQSTSILVSRKLLACPLPIPRPWPHAPGVLYVHPCMALTAPHAPAIL